MGGTQVMHRESSLRPGRSLPANILLWSAIFLTMVLGMVASVLHRNLLTDASFEMSWSFIFHKDIIVPILVSPMVFGGIYGFMKANPNNIESFLFAFQNGFFWKAVLGEPETPTVFPQ